MKDAEFIELLNLYVDQEISVADAARLEAEVLQNPARRKTYQEYCRIQKACKLLARDFATPAATGNMVAFDSRPASRAGQYAALGAFAAAACLAVVFMNRDVVPSGSPAAPLAQGESHRTSAPAEVSGRAVSGGIVHASSVATTAPAMGRNSLLLSGQVQSSTLLASGAGQTNGQFEWMRTVQLVPLPQHVPADSLRFDTTPVPLDDGRTYHSPQSGQLPVESVGFRFNK